MKKYKLLRRLPDLREGVIFRESADHKGYCNCVDPVGDKPNVEPHYFYNKAFVENARDWFEEVK